MGREGWEAVSTCGKGEGAQSRKGAGLWQKCTGTGWGAGKRDGWWAKDAGGGGPRVCVERVSRRIPNRSRSGELG